MEETNNEVKNTDDEKDVLEKEKEKQDTQDNIKEGASYLPIGSVVLLEGGKRRLMVYGRKLKSKDDNQEYDYMGCLYPEGATNGEDVILFNHNQIQMVYFVGFQDLEEIVYRTKVL